MNTNILLDLAVISIFSILVVLFGIILFEKYGSR